LGVIFRLTKMRRNEIRSQRRREQPNRRRTRVATPEFAAFPCSRRTSAFVEVPLELGVGALKMGCSRVERRSHLVTPSGHARSGMNRCSTLARG
jgi:hypothetical protein